MPNRKPGDELLSAALGPANDCPRLEDLERLLNKDAPTGIERHVAGCSYCQTELQMLRSFTSNQVGEHEKTAVDAIAARLKVRSSTIPTRRTALVESRHSWWKRIFEVRWLSPAAATLAIVLVFAGITIEVRRERRPSLDTGTSGAEVLRSSGIAILSPIGDLREKPTGIRWEAAPNATRYRVRIMEVDHTELWNTDATSPRVDLPPDVESLIVPWKTLLVQVAAFDASGRKLAESETVRFRLLQKFYTH